MALTRQDPTVKIAVQGSFQPQSYALDSALQAQSFGQLSNMAATAFDMVKKDYDEGAVRQAQIDAPALIQRDGKGLTIPVATFEPPGFSGRAYRDAYRTLGQNLYQTSVEGDHQNFLNNLAVQHPTDLASAREKMTERVNSVVAGLDTQVAPLTTLRLNAMNGQLESKINANVQAEQNKVAEENAVREGHGTILEAAKLAKTPDRFDPETLALNGQMLSGRFTRATELMKSAGWGEAKISKYWNDARVQTEIARDVQALRTFTSNAENTTSGDMERDQLRIISNIEAKRQKLGPDGDAYYSAMTNAFGQMLQRNNIAIHVKELEAQKGTDEATIAAKKALADLEGQKNTPLWTAQISDLRAERNAALIDPSLSASQRLKRYAAMNSVLGEGKTEFSDMVAGTMTQLYSQATTPTGTVEGTQRAQAARYELERIVNDDSITRHLPLGVRNYGERAVASIIADGTKTDVSMGMVHGLSGRGTVEALIAQGDDWHKRGIIGAGPDRVMTYPEFTEYFQKSRAAILATQSLRRTSEQALDKWHGGELPTSVELDAVRARTGGLILPGGGTTPDFTKPGHADAVIKRLSGTGDLAPEAIEALKNTPRGANPAASVAAAEAYRGIEAVYAAHGMTPNHRTSLLGAKLGHDVVSFLKNVPLLGHDLAVQEFKSSSSPSTSQQGGGPEAQTEKQVSLAMDAVAQTLGPGAEPGLWARMAGLDRTQETTRRILGGDAPTLGGLVLNSVNVGGGVIRDLTGGTWGTSATYQKITYDPEWRAEVERRAGMIIRRDGKAMKTSNAGEDIHKLAVMTAMEQIRDETEIAKNPKDSSTGIMGFVSANKKLAGAMGYDEPITDEQNRLFSIGLFRQHEAARVAAGHPASIWSDFDQSSVRTQRWRDPETGAMTWIMAANHKNSTSSVLLMEMADKDPRLSAFVGDLKNQWAQHLRDKWYNKDPKGTPATLKDKTQPGSTSGIALQGLQQAPTGEALVSDPPNSDLMSVQIDKMTGITDLRSGSGIAAFDRGRAIGPDVDAFLAGNFAGKLGALMIDSTKDMVSGIVLNRHKERLLQNLGDMPADHFSKRMFDAIFGTDMARTMGAEPMINMNPLDILPTFPSNPDWKRIREAVKKTPDPRMEEKSRALQFMLDREATPSWAAPPVKK